MGAQASSLPLEAPYSPYCLPAAPLHHTCTSHAPHRRGSLGMPRPEPSSATTSFQTMPHAGGGAMLTPGVSGSVRTPNTNGYGYGGGDGGGSAYGSAWDDDEVSSGRPQNEVRVCVCVFSRGGGVCVCVAKGRARQVLACAQVAVVPGAPASCHCGCTPQPPLLCCVGASNRGFAAQGPNTEARQW